ncbi:MAG: hypothetical protein ABI775_11985, partial [Pseudonocardiales bacterium]
PVALRGYRFAETDLLLDRLVEELLARDDEIARLRRPATPSAPGSGESAERESSDGPARTLAPAGSTPPVTSSPLDKSTKPVAQAQRPPGVDAVAAAAAKSRAEKAAAGSGKPGPSVEPKPRPKGDPEPAAPLDRARAVTPKPEPKPVPEPSPSVGPEPAAPLGRARAAKPKPEPKPVPEPPPSAGPEPAAHIDAPKPTDVVEPAEPGGQDG